MPQSSYGNTVLFSQFQNSTIEKSLLTPDQMVQLLEVMVGEKSPLQHTPRFVLTWTYFVLMVMLFRANALLLLKVSQFWQILKCKQEHMYELVLRTINSVIDFRSLVMTCRDFF